MTLGLALTAFGLGLRHGIDWDHIAAIADLTGSSSDRRRGFVLSLWYAVGHAAVVLVLGGALILAGATIPESLDTWMGRVVGLTLVLLGGYLVIDLVRQGPDVRLRSRWMLVIDGTFAGFRRVRAWRGRRTISVTHEHPHDHTPELDHVQAEAHDHAHSHDGALQPMPVPTPAPPQRATGWVHRHNRYSGIGHALNTPARVIARSIVAHHDFDIVTIVIEHRAHRPLDRVRSISGRDDNRDFRH